MKTILVALLTFSTLTVFAQNESSEYDLAAATVEQKAGGAKADLLFGLSILANELIDVQSQIERSRDTLKLQKFVVEGEGLDHPSICLQIGRVFTNAINSAVVYGSRAKSEVEKSKAKATFLSAMNLAHICQKNPSKIVNPEYVKTAFGEDLTTKVVEISTPIELIEELQKMMELNKVED